MPRPILTLAEASYLFSGHAGSFCTGPLEWRERAGTFVAETYVYTATTFAAADVDLIIRIPIAAPERMFAVVRLHGKRVRRACWNSPHREKGVWDDGAVHGHLFAGEDRLRYDPGTSLKLIPDGPVPPRHSHREAAWSFASWCQIDLGALQWEQPPLWKGDRS